MPEALLALKSLTAESWSSLWISYFTITGIWLATVVSPGPNFLATVQASLSNSRRAGMTVALGIAVGTALWAGLSLAGLGLLFQKVGWLYALVKLAGAAYLIFVGLQMILSARRPAASSTALPLSDRRAFRRGLLTDLSNPKAAAFFTSLFAVAVPPTAPLWFDVMIVASVVAIAGIWYALAACAITWAPVARGYRKARKAIAYITGGLFTAFGAKLAAES